MTYPFILPPLPYPPAALEPNLGRSSVRLHHDAFFAAYADRLYEYDELLEYFVYRHFMKALGDDVLIEKVQFALICTCFIQLLGIYRWLTDGRLTHWEQICLCKACSREIEYNEDNVEAVSRFLTMD